MAADDLAPELAGSPELDTAGERTVARARPSQAHAALGADFYDVVRAADFPKHVLRFRNARWAERVGLGALSQDDWIRHFGMFEPLPGSFEAPLALRYHGHQFRSYNPQLGDGRGFLFAQLYDLQDGRLLDLGTKGSGETPWSRQGDGRLTLKGGVREVLATEMLEATGVYTSKTFSLIETGEDLWRGDEPSPTRSSVLVRLSHSHIRIGTFQRFAYLNQPENLGKLLDHTIRTYMPELWREEVAARAVAFLEEVCRRVARLGAQWMTAGFVHGVLNTDNINVTGESFDYGPWRFAPTYEPGFTAAYFDQTGLYAFGRQPDALAWNLVQLGASLLPLAGQDELEAALQEYGPAFHRKLATALLARLGLAAGETGAAEELPRRWFSFLLDSKAPFEAALFDWRGGTERRPHALSGPRADVYAAPSFAPVLEVLQALRPAADANLGHPYFAQAEPCTMLIDEVEAIWAPIAQTDDWTAFHAKIEQIATMRDAYGN